MLYPKYTVGIHLFINRIMMERLSFAREPWVQKKILLFQSTLQFMGTYLTGLLELCKPFHVSDHSSAYCDIPTDMSQLFCLTPRTNRCAEEKLI